MQIAPEARELILVYREKADLIAKTWTKASEEVAETILYKHSSEWPDERTSNWLNKEKSTFSDTYISAIEEELPYDNLIIETCAGAELINIHWTSGLLSAASWEQIGRLHIPVLVNLHDFNYITGGCHYPSGCSLYEVSCTECPQVSSRVARTVIANQQKLKKHLFNSPTLFWTAPSEWLVKRLKKSGIINNPNNILSAHRNIIDFSNKQMIYNHRINQGLEKREVAIGLVADNLSDSRKGIYLGAEAATIAATLFPSNLIVSLHLIGEASQLLDNFIENTRAEKGCLIETKKYGKINSEQMQDALSRLDILLFPSLEENYSNLLIEAISVGTYCLGFAVGGNIEIANKYPSMMRVLGKNLNINNGINVCQKHIISNLVNLMSSEIASIDLQILNRGSDSAKCRTDHSNQRIVFNYSQTFSKLISYNYNVQITERNNPATQPIDTYEKAYLAETPDFTYNSDHLVAWVNTLDLIKRSRKCHSTGKMFIYCLKPSWDKKYIQNRLLLPSKIWNEYSIITHDKAHIEQLEFWDLMLLVISMASQDSKDPKEERYKNVVEDRDLPLVCAWISQTKDVDHMEGFTTEDLMWECILNECIIQPMKGLYAYYNYNLGAIKLVATDYEKPYDHKSTDARLFQHDMNKLSTKVSQYKITDGPVLWLPTNLYIDHELASDEFLTLVTHAPSWEADYISQRVVNPEAWLRVVTIPHFKAEIDELKYWDTIIYMIPRDGMQSAPFRRTEPNDQIMATSFIAITKSLSAEDLLMYIQDSLNHNAKAMEGLVFQVNNTLNSLFKQLDGPKQES